MLNGTTIIDDQEIPGITGGALDSNEGEPGPIMLQGDHGAIEFRNLTIAPRADDDGHALRQRLERRQIGREVQDVVAPKLATTGAISGVHAPRRLPSFMSASCRAM